MRKKIKLIEPVIGEEEIQNVSKVLRSGWLTEGQQTEEFEKRVKGFVGAKYAIPRRVFLDRVKAFRAAIQLAEGGEK